MNEQYENLLNDAVQFQMAVIKYDGEVREKMKKWAQHHPRKVGSLAESCSYRGELVEKLSRFREVVYECKCLKGYYGDDCSVDGNERLEMEKHVLGLANDLNVTKDSISNQQFYAVFRKLTSSSLGPNSLDNLTSLLSSAHIKSISTAPWDYLSAMDVLLHAHYDHYRETVRALADNDIDQATAMAKIYKRLHLIVDSGMKILAKSLKNAAIFPLTQTSAFQVAYVEIMSETSTDMEIYPSDLRSTNKASDKVRLSFKCNKLAGKEAEYGAVGWAFSSLLFGLEYGFDGVIVSYVVSLQIIDKNKGKEEKALDTADDFVEVIFPLRVTPDTSTLHDNIKCLEITFNHISNSKRIEASKIIKAGLSDSGTPYIFCSFKKVQLHDTYFSVGYLGKAAETNSLNTNVGHSQTVAMDTRDDFNLTVYPKAASLIALLTPVVAWLFAN
jgi:hypothetical protein